MLTIRKTKPEAKNPYYNTKGNGGYSTCIKGKPTDKGCDVLSNCVGFASGAFNEYLGEGREVYDLNCNAENFIERAIVRGLSIVQEPVVGGIMVWQKGTTLSSKDGAGHVAFVAEKHDDNTVLTSESGYNSSAFWTTLRHRGNGNWGQNSAYKYRGCIVNPRQPEEPSAPIVEPETKTLAFKEGDKVIINGDLYVSSNALVASGKVKEKRTTITRVAKGAKHPYNTTGDLGWMNEKDITLDTASKTTTYTVRFGDNLTAISRKFGTTVGKLIELNQAKYPQIATSNGNYIQVGWELTIG